MLKRKIFLVLWGMGGWVWAQTPATTLNVSKGASLFAANCAHCHQADGAGALGLAPPLRGTLGQQVASDSGRRYMVGVMLFGMAGKLQSKGITYTGVMPGHGATLDDEELTVLANHVLEHLNAAELPSGFTPLAASEFAAVRAQKPSAKELRSWRTYQP